MSVLLLVQNEAFLKGYLTSFGELVADSEWKTISRDE